MLRVAWRFFRGGEEWLVRVMKRIRCFRSQNDGPVREGVICKDNTETKGVEPLIIVNSFEDCV